MRQRKLAVKCLNYPIVKSTMEVNVPTKNIQSSGVHLIGLQAVIRFLRRAV